VGFSSILDLGSGCLAHALTGPQGQETEANSHHGHDLEECGPRDFFGGKVLSAACNFWSPPAENKVAARPHRVRSRWLQIVPSCLASEKLHGIEDRPRRLFPSLQ